MSNTDKHDIINNAARVAFRDISQHLRELYKDIVAEKGESFEVWVVTPEKHLNNKDTRRLNRELGVSRVNYLGNKNKIK